ncbi:mannobiose 2-epimerase [Saonia flava]|uniref:Mannobiose 2-epimerase n=1 Tax=Saonia flava TaxID=523696 RepID=A0A846QQX4_9FLAO|nr:AGE family epimerase/isomerase [Saonia flava]NJB71426.1 mannobiose 2-epimerase [Saonia flava]
MKPISYFSTLLKYFLVPFLLLIFSCKETEPKSGSQELLHEIETSLNELVDVWYPRSIDTVHGGFLADFDAEWKAKGLQNKMLVTQARHIWTASTLAMYYGDSKYQDIAAHGYQFLKENMWDDENGGFYTLKGIEGDSLILLSTSKSAYGNSFAIYGLSTYYKISKDTTALNLAKKTFQWLEEHSHDSVYGGYFDIMKQDGSWLLNVKENDNNYDSFVRKDWKDQNSSIHLLECFTALYEVWPDPLLKERLEELLLLIRDTITTKKGSLTLHLERDWTPVSFKDSTETVRKANFWLDHISFGHDVETAFLMLEASHALGIKNDTTTLSKGKKMVDHAIAKGWDSEKGGFYDGGYYLDDSDTCTIENPAKVWWTQAEGLNSLLLLSKLYPNEKQYSNLFKKQWEYLDTYMIDHKNGGWYHEGLDSKPSVGKDVKAHVWKVNYHNIRALVNVIKMLKGEFVLTKESH